MHTAASASNFVVHRILYYTGVRFSPINLTVIIIQLRLTNWNCFKRELMGEWLTECNHHTMRQSPVRSLFATLSCVFSVWRDLFFSSNNVSSVFTLSLSATDDVWTDDESTDELENSSDFITLQSRNKLSRLSYSVTYLFTSKLPAAATALFQAWSHTPCPEKNGPHEHVQITL